MPSPTSRASTCWPTCACARTYRASTPSRPRSAATRPSTISSCQAADYANKSQRILVVQGSGFNWPATDHLRIVTLQHADEIEEAIGRLGEFLATRRA
jgi:aspartate/methionine/tyrosine aminotransferase